MVYCYNGDDFDEDTLNGFGFGGQPPFLGIKTLASPLNAYVPYYGNNQEIYHRLRAERSNPPVRELVTGKLFTDLQTTGSIGFEPANDSIYGVSTGQRTFFAFHGDPRDSDSWNDLHQGYPKGERYGVLNHFNHPRLKTQDRHIQHFAITLAKGANNYLDNLDLLKSTAQEAEDFIIANFEDKINAHRAPPVAPKTKLQTDSLSVELAPGLSYFFSMGQTVTNPDEWRYEGDYESGKFKHVRTGATVIHMTTPLFAGYTDPEKDSAFAFSEDLYRRNVPHSIGSINTNPNQGASALVKVSQEDIAFHLDHYTESNYQMPVGIANWPANGNTGIGEMEQMAPFADQNNNGIYEPNLGEYPSIVGDAMVYSISNVTAAEFGVEYYNGPPLEIHSCFYIFKGPTPQLSNSVFQTTRIFHRGDEPVYDFRIGNFIDYDLGNPDDDFTGCDSTNNLFFCYNGDQLDETDNEIIGFEEDPPYLGVKYTDRKLDGFISTYRSTYLDPPPTEMTDPKRAKIDEFLSISNHKWRDGTAMINLAYGHELVLDTLNAPYRPTNYYFHGSITDENEWNDFYHGFKKGDRRGIGNFEAIPVFSPGNVFSYTVLYHLNLPDGPSYPYDIDNLTQSTNEVATYWEEHKDDNPIFNNRITGIEKNKNRIPRTVRVFPNPGTGIIYLDGESEIQRVTVYTTAGKRVNIAFETQHNKARLNASPLPKGVYLLKITYQNGFIAQSKFIKK